MEFRCIYLVVFSRCCNQNGKSIAASSVTTRLLVLTGVRCPTADDVCIRSLYVQYCPSRFVLDTIEFFYF